MIIYCISQLFYTNMTKIISHLIVLRTSMVAEMSAYNAGDLGSIPVSGGSPGEGNVNPLQYSCLENPMDRGARWVIAPGVTRVRH